MSDYQPEGADTVFYSWAERQNADGTIDPADDLTPLFANATAAQNYGRDEFGTAPHLLPGTGILPRYVLKNRTLVIFDSLASFRREEGRVDREQRKQLALAKLTDEERLLLGLD